jgi:predicted glutamine amidotransferase
MARLFGLIGNRADLLSRAIAFERDALRVGGRAPSSGDSNAPRSRVPWAWGIGFYQGGEVLMRKRPLDEKEDIEIEKIVADVRADVLIGHVRAATVGALRTENTHPFRSRQWLFAATGTLPQFDQIRDRMVSSLPDFLRGGIRGETDSEVIFHVFLSFLHDAGRIADLAVPASAIREAMRSTFAVVDGMVGEVGGDPVRLNALVTDGEHIVAVNRGMPMAYRILQGKDDADALIGDDLNLRRKTPEPAQMHCVIVASDFDEKPSGRWKTVPERSIVTLVRGKSPEVEKL